MQESRSKIVDPEGSSISAVESTESPYVESGRYISESDRCAAERTVAKERESISTSTPMRNRQSCPAFTNSGTVFSRSLLHLSTIFASNDMIHIKTMPLYGRQHKIVIPVTGRSSARKWRSPEIVASSGRKQLQPSVNWPLEPLRLLSPNPFKAWVAIGTCRKNRRNPWRERDPVLTERYMLLR